MPRSGTGLPPEGCTCLLNHWVEPAAPSTDRYTVRGVIVHWSVHIADPACPHHGDKRKEDDE